MHVQPLDDPWKYDLSKEIQYVVVGSLVILARNLERNTKRIPRHNGYLEEMIWQPKGEIYLAFHHECQQADGKTYLSEKNTVSGGVSIEEAKQLAEQIDRAIKLVESGEVE